MTFQAQYRGVCPGCDEPIRPGDPVDWSGKHSVVHAVCPDPALTVTREPCGTCFQVPAVNGACGCGA